jgi:DNA repair exonuclease SbcCD ATPase subunit
VYLKKLRADKIQGEKKLERVMQDLEQVVTQQSAAQKALKGLQERRHKHEVDLARLKGARADLAGRKAACEARRGFLKERAKEGLDRVKKLRDEPNPYRDRLEVARARVGIFESDLKVANKELEAKRVELAHYEFWVKGFGSRGLPSLLLDSVMPFITTRANDYLLTLADGDLSVAFSTQRELKSKKGEMRDEITKECVVEGVPGATPSKGQRRKYEIATDLALVDLAETREGSSGLLFMDEVLDGLDDEGEARVLHLLRDLRSRYSSLFVVTHETKISEGFDRVLHVTKKNKSSTVEVLR